MREAILTKLDEISRNEKILILFACESGSRGWKFSSVDSDYDVRFIYLRQPETYLSIHPVRDVIELPISDQLDVLGWDFRKTLQLFQRSNSRLLEWMSSPIVYVEPHHVVQALWRLAPDYFSPSVCGKYYFQAARHYFSMAIEADRMHVKKIFYALRMLLAVNWIEKTDIVVPMNVWTSVDRLVTSAELRQAIEQLYVAKSQTSEQSEIAVDPVLQAYCEGEIHRLETIVPTFRHRVGEDWPLNDLFRCALTPDHQSTRTRP